MEEKRRDAGTLTPANASESPAPEPPSTTRRRASAHKRKSNAAFGSPISSSSTSSKRLAREKASISHHHHNGPLTRARQSPSLLGSGTVKIEESAAAVAVPEPVVDKVAEKREALEATIEAEFEAIKSRDANVHVVPAHCGWFSWTKLHPLEECALPSFFNKKTDGRNPDMYMEIRNWIIKRFHAKPNTQIEAKDLSELEVGDVEARQEVMDFLEYWGLINFHPSLTDSDKADVDGDGESKKDSLLEKLYSFETAKSCIPVTPKNNIMKPAVSSGLFPESAFAEELMRQEGPAVEYHCDSCSTDCSRKRYHCKKEADFDLCTDCFNNGKFGSNMSSSDFILMEPAELNGVSGGKWTDQETLLLLEALELYKENWNEIAEHVATKTKAQCMLHFVQMPIEDDFLDCENDVDGGNSKETNNLAINSDSSTPKEAPETTESKSATDEGLTTTSLTQTSKPEDASEEKNFRETPKEDDTNDTKADDTSESKDTSNTKAGQEASRPEGRSLVKVEDESGENLALKALRDAFEDIGYSLAPDSSHSFAEVGNPVMAVAAFLARLVGPDLASASARCSLKSLSGSPPGLQLAIRHCYCLEDPPDEMKELIGIERVTAELIDQDGQKDVKEKNKVQRDDNLTTCLDSREFPNDQQKEKVEDLPVKEKEKLESMNGGSSELYTRNVGTVVANEEAKTGTADEASSLELAKDHHFQTVEKPSDGVSIQNQTEISTIDSRERNPMKSQSEDATMDVDIVPHSQSADTKMDAIVPGCRAFSSGTSKNAETSKDSHAKTGAERRAVSDHPPSKDNNPQQLTSSVVVESEEGENRSKDGKNENITRTEKNQDIDKIKHAALSALTAAAVKARLLADQEEEEIQKLASSLIEKQLDKLETKLSLFNEMDNVTMRVKEQLERSRQRLYHERAQIIASRLGVPATSSRRVPTSLPANRMATNFSNSSARPPMFMAAQRPPMSRSVGTVNPSTANPLASSAVSTGPVHSSSQEKLSSVGIK